MDVFKLAFETTVVGLLTIGWLAVAAYFLFPDFRLDSIVGKPAEVLQKYPAAVGVVVLTLAYCLGSAVLPIAKQLVNDEHWPLNEKAIRCQVFTRQEQVFESILQTDSRDSPAIPKLPHEQAFSPAALTPGHCSYWAPIFDGSIIQGVKGFCLRWIGSPSSPDDKADDSKADQILAIFQQLETIVLSQPSERTQDLRQLYERIVVLRGAVFSTFILLSICVFAYLAPLGAGSSHWARPACGFAFGLLLLTFAGCNGYNDLHNHDIFDIPVLETLLAVITIFGMWLVIFKKARNERFHSTRYILVSLFFTALTYGGWMWSEIIYDQQIINNSFVALQQSAPAPKQ